MEASKSLGAISVLVRMKSRRSSFVPRDRCSECCSCNCILISSTTASQGVPVRATFPSSSYSIPSNCCETVFRSKLQLHKSNPVTSHGFACAGMQVMLQNPPRFTTAVESSESRNSTQSARGVIGAPWPPSAKSCCLGSVNTAQSNEVAIIEASIS